MKEITLLIFIFACCYFVYHFILKIIHPHRYRIVFFIPRTSDTNISFGSMFFCIAIALIYNNIYLSPILYTIGFLLLLYSYWLLCYKKFFYNKTCPFAFWCKNIAQKQIKKQLILNQKYKHSYNKTEALKILGLPPATNYDKNILENHYQQIISNLTKYDSVPEELFKTLEQAKQIIIQH